MGRHCGPLEASGGPLCHSALKRKFCFEWLQQQPQLLRQLLLQKQQQP